MESAWALIEREVAATPMPREYAGLHRSILCKDCNTPSVAIFHIVGMKCDKCNSFNTTLDKGPLLVTVEVAEGEEKKFRPITEAEETLLAGATFHQPVNEIESPESPGSEASEEDIEGGRAMHEEDLD